MYSIILIFCWLWVSPAFLLSQSVVTHRKSPGIWIDRAGLESVLKYLFTQHIAQCAFFPFLILNSNHILRWLCKRLLSCYIKLIRYCYWFLCLWLSVLHDTVDTTECQLLCGLRLYSTPVDFFDSVFSFCFVLVALRYKCLLSKGEIKI